MSDDIELLSWTDLPENIKPDFVSRKEDYDYPLYLSEKEEWVHIKKMNYKGTIRLSEPFLIMELNRFVPYMENKYVKFHPLNLPNINIGKIEIVGFVVRTFEDVRFYRYQVDDGTGTITVFYDKKQFEMTVRERNLIDDKYRNNASNINIKQLKCQKCPNNYLDPRPDFEYPDGTNIRDILIYENNWSLETHNGTLGRKVQRSAYVHAVGYCTVDFLCGKRPREEITFKDLINSKLNFLATRVTCLTDGEYNKKLLMWMNTSVRRRYDEHPNEPQLCQTTKHTKVQAKS
ncbi:uncharacterized protein LOC143425354 [Xylocopa sonorina]|uniref:uncharacterized protein LOC143425354 n=1 Tax=Xylocopa sonorina TaxID=1818115 RepID=UPI00403AD763